MEKITNYTDKIWNMALEYGPKIIGASVVLIIGLWLINFLGRQMAKIMSRRKIDISLRSFLSSLINIVLKIFLIVTVAGMLGIQTASFVAVLGAAGLAVGLALQGSLSNFAGGILMLIFKPFKVGDVIESGGQLGTVMEIQIFNTVLLTGENKTVILPNGAVSNGTIINHSRHGNLRVDITIPVDPGSDMNKVKEVIQDVFASEPKVLKDPPPSVNILKIADGVMMLTVRPYAIQANYWDVYFGVQDKIKTTFEKNEIKSPMPSIAVYNKS